MKSSRDFSQAEEHTPEIVVRVADHSSPVHALGFDMRRSLSCAEQNLARKLLRCRVAGLARLTVVHKGCTDL